MWTSFKVFIELVTILLMFYVLVFFFFGHEACGILAPRQGIKPTTPVLEGKILTTGPPGKSPYCILKCNKKLICCPYLNAYTIFGKK